jgi:hypothetical protein
MMLFKLQIMLKIIGMLFILFYFILFLLIQVIYNLINTNLKSYQTFMANSILKLTS